ncbi:MAG: hypothetical protein R3F11_14705 [Verrucomicrobiales bacterium]
MEFQALGDRRDVANFKGGHHSSDGGGAVILREIESHIGLRRRLVLKFYSSYPLKDLFAEVHRKLAGPLTVRQPPENRAKGTRPPPGGPRGLRIVARAAAPALQIGFRTVFSTPGD